jgi:hypothetical protein
MDDVGSAPSGGAATPWRMKPSLILRVPDMCFALC